MGNKEPSTIQGGAASTSSAYKKKIEETLDVVIEKIHGLVETRDDTFDQDGLATLKFIRTKIQEISLEIMVYDEYVFLRLNLAELVRDLTYAVTERLFVPKGEYNNEIYCTYLNSAITCLSVAKNEIKYLQYDV